MVCLNSQQLIIFCSLIPQNKSKSPLLPYLRCSNIVFSSINNIFLGRAGVPFEVMGLILGEYLDEFTVCIYDVFAMPSKATTVSVESVDPVYQTKMLEML